MTAYGYLGISMLASWALLTALLPASQVTASRPGSSNAATIANKMALLNCSLPNTENGSTQGATVTWLRPHDSLPVSRGYQVFHDMRRLIVIGDPSKGQFNLLIRRARFPEDNGTWTCMGSTGVIRTTPLVVLVPPSSRDPTVSPSNISITDDTTEAWTLTCASHFAFPPVELSWVKVSGPESDYDVTLPDILVANDKTISMNVKIILNRRNIGSVFTCEARHPTFLGNVFTKEVPFPGIGLARALEQVSGTEERQMLAAKKSRMNKEISGIDSILVTTVACTGTVIFVIIVILVKSNKSWYLDVNVDEQPYMEVSTNDQEADGSLDEEKAQAVALETLRRRARIRCKVQATVGASLSVLLLLSLAMSFPIYFKGMTPPDLGTDVLSSVVAGSALWLDCSDMCQPASSVLSVKWIYNHQTVYHQYYTNGKHVGVPHNTTEGFKFYYRASSLRYGQVNIWPVLPGEDGVYVCEVAKVANNEGKTVIARKSFSVFVITGMIVNYALIALLGIASGSAIILIILLLYKCVKCRCSRPKKMTNSGSMP